eukprot:486687-Karenia_brevis.AAC.1
MIIRGSTYDHLGHLRLKIWSSGDQNLVIWGSKYGHLGVRIWSSGGQNMVIRGSKYNHPGFKI